MAKRSAWGVLVLTLVVSTLTSRPAAAQEQLCDPSYQNCRTPLLTLIQNERVGIDVAFWFMEDHRYADALVARFKEGVPVRVLVDTRANAAHPLNADMINELKSAGIPIRRRTASSILHWKMMLFAGQNAVEFSGANYSVYAFAPATPYTNYVDEAIYFTQDASVVNSFKAKFDSSWVDTVSFANYANLTNPPAKHYGTYPQDPELNFPPTQSYASRALSLYNNESTRIDVIMFRITQQLHSDAMIAAKQRGVPVRVYTSSKEYRDASRLWHAWNVDRMWYAGIPVRVEAHAGLNHEKAVILYGQRTVIFGSSNWTSPSDASQQEHNYFVKSQSWIYDWFVKHFSRKWYNSAGYAETKAFTPLPPGTPKYKTPASGATGVSRTLTLKWYGGPWAHYYDIYFGKSSSPPLYASNQHLGPSATSTTYQSYTIPVTLSANTTYCWKIVSKTAANKTTSGTVWSFRTGS